MTKQNEQLIAFIQSKDPSMMDVAINQCVNAQIEASKTLERFNGLQVAIQHLLSTFKERADGFAKLETDVGNRLSNEYLTVISDFQQNIDLVEQPLSQSRKGEG